MTSQTWFCNREKEGSLLVSSSQVLLSGLSSFLSCPIQAIGGTPYMALGGVNLIGQ